MASDAPPSGGDPRGPSAAAATGDADAEAVLASIGLRSVGDDLALLRAAATQIARLISHKNLQLVGFVPADDSVSVPAALVHIGLALVELTGATVAVVDANVRYPGLAALRNPQIGDEMVFSTRWLRGSLALLSPAKVERAGEVLPQLERLLQEGAELFKHVLVDLTAFDALGEHAAAASVMDGVVIAGRRLKTKESDLLDLVREIPQERFLGVMLVG